MMRAHTRSVLVVDDHRTFTELLTMALDTQDRLRCVGAATDGASALAVLDREEVDVVVMDYRIGTENGIELAGVVTRRWPNVSVVMLTAYPTQRLMRDAANAGASALLPKDGSLEEVVAAVLEAQPGEFTVPPGLLRLLVTERDPTALTPLTSREIDVLDRLALGHDVRAISRELSISVNTCRGYVRAILAKLEAHSQLEAVARAHRLGLLGPGSHRG